MSRSSVVYVGLLLISLSALGFLASEEVKAAGVGNIGLQDRRSLSVWIVFLVINTMHPQNVKPFAGFESILEHLEEIRQK